MKHIIKKQLLRATFALTVGLLLFALCGNAYDSNRDGDNETVMPQMTMTGVLRNGIGMLGNGMVTIDWGDGTSSTYTLSENPPQIPTVWKDGTSLTYTLADDTPKIPCPIYTHTYSSADVHTITITGSRINLLDCSENDLTAVDVSNNRYLLRLDCYENQITTLDVSKNTALRILLCYKNQLTTVNVSKNTALMWLYCDINQITTLDISKNMTLKKLGCQGNQLTALDLSNNTELTFLDCCENQITTLDVSKNTELTMFDCGSNQLAAEALNALFGMLPESMAWEWRNIVITGNPGVETCNSSIAEAKNWTVSVDIDTIID